MPVEAAQRQLVELVLVELLRVKIKTMIRHRAGFPGQILAYECHGWPVFSGQVIKTNAQFAVTDDCIFV